MTKRTRSGKAAEGPALLDTHTLLWALGSPERLSAMARAIVDRRDVVLSIACYWEVVIKAQKGLLNISDPVAWWQRATTLVGAPILPIRANHISSLVALPHVHKDPFDRILTAQAIAEGLGLVTNDPLIAQYPVRIVW